MQIENVGPLALLTTPNKDSIVTAINSLKDLSLPKTVNIECGLIANLQNEWMSFSVLPFNRADLYNLTIKSQYPIGTNTVATFDTSRFMITQSKNGFTIFSNDADIKSWFQSGNIYMFRGTATLK